VRDFKPISRMTMQLASWFEKACNKWWSWCFA